MTEPTFTPATETAYAALAGYLRTADRRQGNWPLKRYLGVVTDQLGFAQLLLERADCLSPDELDADNRPLTFYTNLAVNPSFEDADPLPTWELNATAGRDSAHPDSSDGGTWAWLFEAVAAGDFGGTLAPNRLGVASGLLTVSLGVYAFPGRTVRITGDCFDAAGGALGQVHTDVAYVGPGYQRLAGTLVLPLGTAGVDLSGFVLAGAGGGEQAYVDTVLAVEGDTRLPYRRYAGVATGETSELVTPETADDAWLPWLAQLVGVQLNLALTRPAKVDAIRYASAGWQGGTKSAVAAAAKSALTGTRYVQVYDHSTEAGIGTGDEWDVLLITRATETPSEGYGDGGYGTGGYGAAVSAVLQAVIDQNAKPAGVVLHHLSYNATWAAIEAAYPTWADWRAAGTWQRIEEAGL